MTSTLHSWLKFELVTSISRSLRDDKRCQVVVSAFDVNVLCAGLCGVTSEFASRLTGQVKTPAAAMRDVLGALGCLTPLLSPRKTGGKLESSAQKIETVHGLHGFLVGHIFLRY